MPRTEKELNYIFRERHLFCMLSSLIQTEIFKKIPKTFRNPKDSSGNLTCYVDYAERVQVSDQLAFTPAVATFRFLGGAVDDRASPRNKHLKSILRPVVGTPLLSNVVDIIGERFKTIMSLNVYSKGTSTLTAGMVADAYMDAILVAILVDLPEVVGIVVQGHGSVSDLSYLQDGNTARRQIDINLAYMNYVEVTHSTIETIIPPTIENPV